MITDERLRELWANGFTITVMVGPFVEQFARAVEREARREERERCAKVAEAYEPRCDVCPSGCADAIRALKDEACPTK